MKRRTLMQAAAGGALLAAGAAAARAAPGITIATGTKGTAYHLIGQALADQLRDSVPQSACVVLDTSGGVENMRLLREGKAQVAFVNAAAAWEASLGLQQFEGQPVPLRAVAALYPNSMHLVVRQGSGIARLRDLRGRRVATGAPGSGTEVIVRQMLTAVGLDPDQDVQRARLGLAESIAALRQGRLDAFLFGAAVPVKPIAELMAEGSAALLSTAEAIEGMNRIYAHLYRRGTILAGTYERQPAAVQPLDVWDLLVVAESLSGELVYPLTRSLFDNKARFTAAHPNMRFLDLARQAQESTVSLHLAAKKYLAEQGVQPFAREMGALGEERLPKR
jgi:TRAP transporter TAXI family solute receptor